MIVTASVMDPTVNGTYRHDRNARVTGDSLTFHRAVGSGISFFGNASDDRVTVRLPEHDQSFGSRS